MAERPRPAATDAFPERQDLALVEDRQVTVIAQDKDPNRPVNTLPLSVRT